MKRNTNIISLLILVVFITASAFNGNDISGKKTPQSQQVANERTAGISVRFIAFGDMGTGDRNQYALAKQMAAWQAEYHYDIALMLGDNIYPDGNPALIPAKFEKPYAELLQRGVKFYAVLGNHDVKTGREAQIKYTNFNMNGRNYYSFVRGDGLVEFFAIDSTNFDIEQGRWLERTLAASTAKWKIAYFHHPIYSSGRTHGSDLKLRAKLELLFVQYGVAAAFSGHDHIYERTKPQQGVQYFISGAGSGKLRRADINRQSPLLAAGNDETCSFMYVEVTRELLNFKAIDEVGKIIDSGTLMPPAAKTRH